MEVWGEASGNKRFSVKSVALSINLSFYPLRVDVAAKVDLPSGLGSAEPRSGYLFFFKNLLSVLLFIKSKFKSKVRSVVFSSNEF